MCHSRFFRNVGSVVYLISSLCIVVVVSGVLLGKSVSAAVIKPEQKIWFALSKLTDIRSWVYDGSVSYYGKVGARYSDLLMGAALKKKSSQYQTLILNFKGGKEILTSRESQSWFSLLTKSSDKKELVFGLETKSVGGNFYATINKIENSPFSVGEYKDVWVQFNVDSILGELGVGESLLEKKDTAKSISEEDEQELKKLFTKSNIFKVGSSYATRSGGMVFDIYNFSVNKDNLKKFATNAAALDTPLVTGRELSTINKNESKVKSISGSIWISRKDGMPYRFSLNLYGTQPREKTSINLNFKQFNQPVPVSEPQTYITWKELFDKIFPQSLNSNTSTPTTTAAMW